MARAAADSIGSCVARLEIADALDHAHHSGIVHRDLKPSERHADADRRETARLRSWRDWRRPTHRPSRGSAGLTRAETLTEQGTIVGTVQYMAPEQLEARETDGRTDIFAFGAVVYEMITGLQAFEGASKASVIAAILERDPPSLLGARNEQEPGSARPEERVPPLLDQIVTRCLAKNPDDRWQTARDLREALTWVAAGGLQSAGPAAATARGWRRPRSIWLAASLVIAIATLTTLAVVIWLSPRTPTDAPSIRLVVSPPKNGTFSESSASMALSPDGHSVAFLASSGQGVRALWIRSLDSLEARQLPGTTEAAQPFWSADSRFLAFISDGGLKRVDATGGLPQTVTDRAAQQSGSWSRDDVIIFRSRSEGNLYQVLAAGGTATPVTTLDRSRAETVHTWPQFLPDGRHFLYLARSSKPEHDSVAYVGSLDARDPIRLFSSDSHVVYAPPGYLIHMRGNTLLAQPFDAGGLRLTGEPVPIAEQVERTLGSQRGAFSVSQTGGVLAYRPIAETQLVWFDRGGRLLERIGASGHYTDPALSPDQQRVAVARLDLETGTSDIWVMELARGIASRFTFDPSPDDSPLWSPDGRRIVFRSRRSFYERDSSGTGSEVLLTELGRNGQPHAWRRDGSFVYSTMGAQTGLDLWLLPLLGDRKPVPLLQTEFYEWQGAPSPDGRWMAYVSDESGRNEVFVRPFTAGEGKWQVSVAGGIEPTWRNDGTELFYLAPDRNLMAVPVKMGATVDASAPIRLFETAMSSIAIPAYTRNQYIVTADGQRFLINQPAEGASPSPITVVINWPAALKK